MLPKRAGVYTGSKDPDSLEIESSCPSPEVASTNIMLQILASTRRDQKDHLQTAKKPSCKVTRVCDVNLCTPNLHHKVYQVFQKEH